MADRNDALKNTFSAVIEDYDIARPRYPAALLESVREFSGLPVCCTALEVGAGTGQATDLFMPACGWLDLLEVSREQVDFLRAKYAGQKRIGVLEGYFETFAPPRRYDLIYSATAFHWVNCEIGYPKAWRMLREGGTLAVFWHMSSVTRLEGGVFDGLNAIKRKYMPGASLGFDAEGIEQVRLKRIRQIQSGGCFGIPEYREFSWTDVYDAHRYARLVNSYSETQLLSPEVRSAYLEEIRRHVDQNGGVVSMPQKVCLYMVQKRTENT